MTEWVVNRIVNSSLAFRPQDMLYPYEDRTRGENKRAGGEAGRTRAVMACMSEIKQATKRSGSCSICFGYEKGDETIAVGYFQ